MTRSLVVVADHLEQLAADLRATASGRLARALRAQLPHVELAASLLHERSRRLHLFEQFGLEISEPGWDILLLLYLMEAEGRRASVSDLCSAGGTPGTTGLRHLKRLELHGVVEREADPYDQRRSWIRYCAPALTAMRLHLEAAEEQGTVDSVRARGVLAYR